MNGAPSRGRRQFPLLLGLITAAALCPPAHGAPPREAAADISPRALQQIRELLAEKEARTPVQRKIDPQLLYATRMAKGQRITASVASLETDLPVVDGGTEVEVRARVSARLEEKIEKLGGVVLGSYAFANSIRASLPLEAVETLAADEDVFFVMPPDRAMTNRVRDGGEKALVTAPPAVVGEDDLPRSAALRASLERRMEVVRAKLSEALPALATASVQPLVGTVTSQGDATHRANLVRNQLGITGAGIKIGVLSDSFNNLGGYAADIASGDLPGPGNPYGYTTPVQLVGSGDMAAGGTDEGRAMLQIIHDLAPGAQLYYATAYSTAANFANNIRLLRAAGCDVIVDDVFYFDESALHSGQPASVVSPYNMAVITQAVNDVTANGALYFSSAGNSGNLSDGNSGAWEGDFASAGILAPFSTFPGGDVLDWDLGAGAATSNGVTACGNAFRLNWADPLGGSTNDYDLFLLDSAGTSVLAASTLIQDGSAPQDPIERMGSCVAGRRLLVLRKPTAAPRFLSVSTLRGRLQYGTAGQARGHSTALDGFGVAATPAAITFGPPAPNGPYPGPFTAGCCQVEPFSSDGYRRMFFDEDNNPITPGNFLVATNGGSIFLKPEITAADGTSTTVSGFATFYGTSAAAPHAGAIAALVKQAGPALTPGQIRAILQSTALDIEAPGVDRDSGHGILDALAAVTATGVAPKAVLRQGTVAFSETAGNGNGIVQPGETGAISVQLVNDGAVNATAVSATLTTTAPGVTITTATSAYPNLTAGGGSASNTTPFAFALSPSAACDASIPFKLTVTFTGGQSPVDFFFTYTPTRVVIQTVLDASAPPASPLYTAATGAQTARIFRDGLTGTCAGDKSFPGVSGSGTRQYDSYTFSTAPGVGTYCVTVTLTHFPSATGKQLFAAAYKPTFVPATIGTNYASDRGVSILNGDATFSFSVAAGQQFTVVVADVIPTGGVSAVGDSYTLAVSGACLGSGGAAIRPVGAVLTADTCPAGGNAIVQPGETVTMSFAVRNAGTGATTNLVATPVASPGVQNPSPASLTYGPVAAGATASQPLQFNVSPALFGACGSVVPVSFNLADGATPLGTATFWIPVGLLSAETFDGVQPAGPLPSGWTTTTASGTSAAWSTIAGSADTAPNAAYAPAEAANTTKRLFSPVLNIPAGGAQVSFRNNYNHELFWDGGVLDISINGGAYQDILAAGGSFLSGGYSGTIYSYSGTSIANRQAWTGSSGGYVTTRIQLPAAANGLPIRLRWSMVLDSAVQVGPWLVDTFTLGNGTCGGPATFLSMAPTSATICTGSSVQLTATFRGTGPFAIQWRKGGVNVVPDGIRIVQQDVPAPGIPDGVLSTLTVNNAIGSDAGSYDAVATGACGAAATSGTAALNVQTSAYTASVTGSASICTGASATATVTTSAPAPVYFWSVTSFGGGAQIVGSNTGASVTYKGTAPGRVVLEATVTPSQGGCILTQVFEVTVLASPATPVITAPSSAEAGATGLVASVASNPGSSYAWTVTNGTITAGQGTASITFTAGTGGTLTLAVVETSATCGSASAQKTIPVSGPGGPCVANATTLCLNGERFEVKVAYTADGSSGSGQAVPFAPAPPDSGYFWFFDAANMELLVKVLDGRGVNGKFWVMYGALSDVEYTITVRDTQTGAVKTYSNPQGTMASVADIEAFSDAGPRSASTGAWEYLMGEKAAGRPLSFSELLSTDLSARVPLVQAESRATVESLSACTGDATSLCLNAGRFKVSVDWQVDFPIGTFGPGRAVPVTTDTGCFWFFNDRNIELAVKVLDGTSLNGHYWVFYGALSDVAYQLKVEDTETGATKTYSNPKGTLASMGDTTAFLP